MIIEFIQKAILALGLGAILGFEREYTKKQEVIGLRTFSLISLLGFLSTYLSKVFFGNFWFVFISLFFVIIFLTYFYKTNKKLSIGWTTSTTIVLTFIIGAMTGLGMLFESTFLTIIIAVVLFSREKLHKIISHLTKKEVSDSIAFLILLGVVYPLLPETFELQGIVIPVLSIWYLVVLISAITFIVFLGARHFKSKHKLQLIAFLSGFVASTALSISLSNIYKKNKQKLNEIVTSFNFSVMAMFIRNFAIFLIVAPFVFELWVMLAAIIVVLFVSNYFLFDMKKPARINLHVTSPFNVLGALKFGVAILVLYVGFDLLQSFFPQLFYATSFFAGAVSTLSFVVSLSALFLTGEIALQEATPSLFLACLGGLLSNIFPFIVNKQYDFLRKNLIPLLLLCFVPILLLLLI